MPNFIATMQQHKEPITMADLAKTNAMVCVVGHLTKDTESGTVGSGNVLKAWGGLAVNFGKKPDETVQFYNWVAWRDKAEAMQSLGRGDAVLLIGKCEIRPWTDKTGAARESAELTVYSVALPVFKRKDAGFSKPAPIRQPVAELPVEDHGDLPF